MSTAEKITIHVDVTDNEHGRGGGGEGGWFSFWQGPREIQLNGQLWNSNAISKTNTTRTSLPAYPSNASAVDDGTESLCHGEMMSERLVIVLVHQMSKLGGCGQLMDGMARRLSNLGYPSITFDMRGVNESAGSCTLCGHSEVQDVVAVCRWAVQNLKAKNILLVGSSAGAPIAGSAVDKVEEVKGFVGIGYVFGFAASLLFGGHYNNILQSKKPKLFISGDADGFTSVRQLNNYLLRASEPKSKFIVKGVGHFELEGPVYDKIVTERIDKFIQDQILPMS
eukprot:GHVQ01004259.1.p1 GENE.GHVQ01004259.1~~GHVQ01004259.1.p1  ORF type:complete len:281 (-),score=43.52 GHVQ01004259.1:415-1257(-)